MPTIFTRIIDGDLPGTFVWKDDLCVAFLSINPLTEGHTLVVPRQEVDHWLDCPAPVRQRLFEVAHTIGVAIDAVWNPARVGVIIAGMEVPHTHVHVLPFWTEAELDFSRAGTADREGLESAAALLREALSRAGAEGTSD
jgi:diadenosine tetraphosphate (Ap4A) HIT family hydrolase